MDRLMEQAYKRLNPTPQEPPPEPVADADSTGEFDGVVWADTAVDANYVPQSIRPELTPIIPPPAPGSVPPEAVAPVPDEFEKEDEVDEDEVDPEGLEEDNV
jgi:hypothetical protein